MGHPGGSMWGHMGDARLPVPVSAYGPLIPLSLRVHRLGHTGRSHEALDAAERIRAAVAADFSAVTPGVTVSISTGLAALRPGMTGADLFNEADQRLYQAKRDGRDRVAG